MAKVALSTKITEELKAELEEQAKKNNITLSEHVANLLTQSNKNSKDSEKQFSQLIKELNEKNQQIKSFLDMQKNEQELKLYDRKILLIEKQEEQQKQEEQPKTEEPPKTEEQQKQVLINKASEENKKKSWWQIWR